MNETKDFDRAIEARVDRWYKGKPSRVSIWWCEQDWMCSISNKDALRLASQILQLQKGKSKGGVL
jgi:hypothetical protein